MLEVIHSPRLEDLADQLAEQLHAQRRRQMTNILQPITVVVGHLGIARWLEQRIAMRFGIFANVRFVLTSEWLNGEMSRFGVLDPQTAAHFSLGAMTWALYALLEAPTRYGLVSEQALSERERFQLSARLARLFDEYLIYRREWLLDFEHEAARGNSSTRVAAPAETKIWQARLWGALSARFNGNHRAAKFHALLRAISNDSATASRIAAPIYFFGFNHLAPDVLTLLQQFAENASVQIYFPNPCVEYWADVVRERFLVQRRLGGDLLSASGTEDPGGFDHFDVGHPLLASLGGHGQAYFAELSHATEHFTEIAPTLAHAIPTTLLSALQYGITHLQPNFAPVTLRSDHSVQVLGARSVVDELTQVKAILFDALRADPTLRLEDIAIMTPNLSRYAPLLPAVFGAELCASPSLAGAGDLAPAHAGPRPQSALRFSVLDTTRASVNALLNQLLSAPELRWEPAQLLALLSIDAVARHFALDAADLDQAEELVARAHIAFGFNDAHRRQLIAATALSDSTDIEPSASLHTWEAGLERLLFGYLVGNQPEIETAALAQTESFDRLWPVPNIDVRHAPILTALLQLIRALRIFNFGVQRNRTVPEWTRWLERQMLALTGTPTEDSVRALFAQIELDAAHAKLHEEVSFFALREACTTAAAQISQRSAPALGAICVCGLVPMRAMPFKVICILGLNETEFPKPETPDALNLMRAIGARRPGDRSRAQEDRYLFLEAIMAARSKLVLSYQGFRSDGRTRLPCGVLTELLAQLGRQFKARVGASPWLVGTQPSKDATLSTQRPALYAASLPGKIALASSGAIDGSEVLSINELLRFWQQPLRSYVHQRLRIAPQPTDSGAFADARNLEPLSLASPPIKRIEARLLAHALSAASFPESAPPWLGHSGLLPSGALGVQSYASIEEAGRAAWLSIKAKFPEFLGAVKQPMRVDLSVGGTRLVGNISDVYLAHRACVCVSSKALHGAQRWQLLLKILLLRASETDLSAPPWRALHLGPQAAELMIDASPSSAREYLANLIALQRAYLRPPAAVSVAAASVASTAPPWFWPKLSYTAFSAKGDAHEAVLKVIEAGQDYELANSGLKLWLPNAAFFDADSAEFGQFLTLAQTLFAPLAPSNPQLNAVANPAPNNATSDPAPRTQVVAHVNLTEPNPALRVTQPVRHELQQSPITPPQQDRSYHLDLEQFGHDDSADFRDDY